MTIVHEFRYYVGFDDVDAAQILYYPRYFHLCHVAFEDYFNQKGPVSYPSLIKERRFGFPAVHVDANFKAPIAYGETITIFVATKHIGTSSLATNYRFIGEGSEKFVATITTVYTDLTLKKAFAIPEELRSFLSGEMVT